MKTYNYDTVIKIMHFIARSMADIMTEETAKEEFEEIPEEFHAPILASIAAGKKVQMLKNMFEKVCPELFKDKE